ncbi:MAG: polysaccharide deacetylase family protein [Bacteriovoracaceae bacterium]
MKRLLLGLSLLTFSFSSLAYFQYPEDRTYGTGDRGYTQYGAPSLHHTGRYALTFDDGPHPTRTPRILDTLKKYNAKAIFFVLTSQITEKTFPLIKRMLDEGHLVGSHGLFHDNSDHLTRQVWKARVKQSFIDLARWYKRAGHELTKPYYRFPYAAYGDRKDYHHLNVLKEISQELMGDNCIHFTFWDNDSGDWIPGMTAQEVLNNYKAFQNGGKLITYKTVKGKILKVVKTITDPPAGGVVLQHDIQESSAVGTDMILKYFQENNLETVRIDEVDEFLITKDCRM